MLVMADGRIYTVAEIATKEHISRDTVKRAIKNRLLRAHRIGARGDYRVREEDYLDWMSRGAPTASAIVDLSKVPPTPPQTDEDE